MRGVSGAFARFRKSLIGLGFVGLPDASQGSIRMVGRNVASVQQPARDAATCAATCGEKFVFSSARCLGH